MINEKELLLLRTVLRSDCIWTHKQHSEELPHGLLNPEKFSLNVRSWSFVIRVKSSPSLIILVTLWFIIIFLVFFYIVYLSFSGFLQFKDNFERGQNNVTDNSRICVQMRDHTECLASNLRRHSSGSVAKQHDYPPFPSLPW